MDWVGKGRRRPTKAQAASGEAQATDPWRFSTGAEGGEPMGGIIDVEITLRRPDGTKKTFEGPDAAARAAEWLKAARRSS